MVVLEERRARVLDDDDQLVLERAAVPERGRAGARERLPVARSQSTSNQAKGGCQSAGQTIEGLRSVAGDASGGRRCRSSTRRSWRTSCTDLRSSSSGSASRVDRERHAFGHARDLVVADEPVGNEADAAGVALEAQNAVLGQ